MDWGLYDLWYYHSVNLVIIIQVYDAMVFVWHKNNVYDMVTHAPWFYDVLHGCLLDLDTCYEL